MQQLAAVGDRADCSCTRSLQIWITVEPGCSTAALQHCREYNPVIAWEVETVLYCTVLYCTVLYCTAALQLVTAGNITPS